MECLLAEVVSVVSALLIRWNLTAPLIATSIDPYSCYSLIVFAPGAPAAQHSLIARFINLRGSALALQSSRPRGTDPDEFMNQETKGVAAQRSPSSRAGSTVV